MRGETLVVLTASSVEIAFKDDPDYRQIIVEVFNEVPEARTDYIFLSKEKAQALRDTIDAWLRGKL